MVEIKTTMDKKTEEEENHERILDHLEQIKSKISNRERDGGKIKKSQHETKIIKYSNRVKFFREKQS